MADNFAGIRLYLPQKLFRHENRTPDLAAALLLSGLSAYGQQAKQTLSFDEALAAALQNNPALEAAVYEEKAAMQERRAAIGLRMPKSTSRAPMPIWARTSDWTSTTRREP